MLHSCPPSSLPSRVHGPWVLSLIPASPAGVSTARSRSPQLPSLLLLPFSSRVAFSSFICPLGWYVIRAGVLMGNTKWFFRGAGFECRSGRRSGVLQLPLSFALPSAPSLSAPHKQEEPLGCSQAHPALVKSGGVCVSIGWLLHPTVQGPWSSVSTAPEIRVPSPWLWKVGTFAVVRTPLLNKNNEWFHSSCLIAALPKDWKKISILH